MLSAMVSSSVTRILASSTLADMYTDMYTVQSRDKYYLFYGNNIDTT